MGRWRMQLQRRIRKLRRERLVSVAAGTCCHSLPRNSHGPGPFLPPSRLLPRQALLLPPRAALERRLSERHAAGQHFMPPALLDSQLAALELEGPPEWLLVCRDGAAAADVAAEVAAAWEHRLTAGSKNDCRLATQTIGADVT